MDDLRDLTREVLRLTAESWKAVASSKQLLADIGKIPGNDRSLERARAALRDSERRLAQSADANRRLPTR